MLFASSALTIANSSNCKANQFPKSHEIKPKKTIKRVSPYGLRSYYSGEHAGLLPQLSSEKPELENVLRLAAPIKYTSSHFVLPSMHDGIATTKFGLQAQCFLRSYSSFLQSRQPCYIIKTSTSGARGND